MNLHEKENELFREWIEHIETLNPGIEVEDLFCPDGLHYTGLPVKKDGEHFVIDRDYKEEAMWTKSNRVVYLTKDHNLDGDEEGIDVRDDSGIDNKTGKIGHHFHKRYLYLNYGLGNMNLSTGDVPEIGEAKGNALEYFHRSPIVRMNLKKIAGGKQCPDGLLGKYINKDRDFIVRQLALYDGRIYVCMDGSESSPVLALLKSIFHDLQRYESGEENNFIYFSQKSRIVVIHEWHPSCSISYDLYYSAVHQLSDFLKCHPDFFSI